VTPPCAFSGCQLLQSHGPYCSKHYYALREGRQPREKLCLGCRNPIVHDRATNRRSQYCSAACAMRAVRQDRGAAERGMSAAETERFLEERVAAESLPPWLRNPQPIQGPFLMRSVP